MHFKSVLLSCFSCSSTMLVCVCACILINGVEADKRNRKNKVQHKDLQHRTLSDQGSLTHQSAFCILL